MEGPISFRGYKEQESNLILPEHDDDDDILFISTLIVTQLYSSPPWGWQHEWPKHVVGRYLMKSHS